MTVTIQPDDTGEHRRPVGEDTRIIPAFDPHADLARRPDAEPTNQWMRRSFALADITTGELPLISIPADPESADPEPVSEEPAAPAGYAGRHRVRDAAPPPPEAAPEPVRRGLLLRALARVGINLAGGAR
ncbi:hypothetical protein [Actinoplanes teichomyceticus]|uniref:Uncharacterized protein n=1 Tax=Actinoplanes teichomyceticus TaxID=1867 RepID=A0A561WAX0_ACTTI|nr:hypothetical protein [Actinoplanes teichomyceticus]TWG21010.1 hypothetical protein FHX34_103539 [Actinoplanes teichomyceticus]GIF14831.1 hypothetical protein Ate01nite_48630 [Actinoplanes teichomyceticus]